MSANVETMFYVRTAPWHGLGVNVQSALSSKEALEKSGLDWRVIQKPIRMEGELIDPYLVFCNSHDGSGAIKVAMTPVRVVCQNTLNLALASAKRVWATVHVGDLAHKMDEAHNTLLLAGKYMRGLGMEFAKLSKIKLSDQKVEDFIAALLPMDDAPSAIHRKNIDRVRDDLRRRYFDAPDLQDVGRNGYRFINAVSDFATHAKPLRTTANYQENVFARTVEGSPLIDRAYEMVLAA